MAKKTIIAILMATVLLIGTVAPSYADHLNVATYRADIIERILLNPGSSSPNYQYWYLGSMKGSSNSYEWLGNRYYTVISLWDIWDPLESPTYLEDFYTYTLKFKLAFEEGVAYFDDWSQIGESLISAASSVHKNEIYGQNPPVDSNPVNSIYANPLLATQGGYSLPLNSFFENIAVGSEVVSADVLEVSIVFSTPARTLEHQWDMLIIDLGMLQNGWNDDTEDEWIYFAGLDVVYDKDLSAYESAVQAGLTEIGGKIDDLNNTIQQGQDQAHQDANDIKDAINNQGENEKNEASSGGNANVAALQSSMGDFDLATYGEAIDTLMSSLSYDGTDTTWTLPSSGTVPFLNTTLWKEQEVDLCPDYIVNLESFNLITVFTNFVVAIGCVYVVVNVFNDLLTTMNGAKGDDTKYTEG